jgi:hypothetical protein
MVPQNIWTIFQRKHHLSTVATVSVDPSLFTYVSQYPSVDQQVSEKYMGVMFGTNWSPNIPPLLVLICVTSNTYRFEKRPILYSTADLRHLSWWFCVHLQLPGFQEALFLLNYRALRACHLWDKKWTRIKVWSGDKNLHECVSECSVYRHILELR